MSSPVMLTRLSIVDAVLIIDYQTDLVKITAVADPSKQSAGGLVVSAASKRLFTPPPPAQTAPSSSSSSSATSVCLCPPSPAANVPTTPTVDMDFCLNADFRRINRTIEKLRTSGFYYEGLSWQQANTLLHKTEVGTFLLRDSADPKSMFSLSVQTERGPTSVRIHYTNGQFRLDSEDEDNSTTSFAPEFDCVLQLVEYFTRLSQSHKGSQCVWLDSSGRDVPIRLSRPLYQSVLPLQHLCRLSVNRLLQKRACLRNGGVNPQGVVDRDVSQLELPTQVKHYLRDYPYQH